MIVLYQNRIMDCDIVKTFSDGYIIELMNSTRLYVSSYFLEIIESGLEILVSEEIYLLDLVNK